MWCVQDDRPRDPLDLHGAGAEQLHLPGDREPRGARRHRRARLLHRALQPHPGGADRADALSGALPGGGLLLITHNCFYMTLPVYIVVVLKFWNTISSLTYFFLYSKSLYINIAIRWLFNKLPCFL